MAITSNFHNLRSVAFVAYWDSAVPMIALQDMHTAHKCILCVLVFFFTFIFYYFFGNNCTNKFEINYNEIFVLSQIN